MPKGKCRVCLKEGVMRNIFEERYFSTISIYPEDGLPCTICSKCVKILDKCTNFIQLCQESDAKLRSMLLVKTDSSIINMNKDSNDLQCENIDLSIKSETLRSSTFTTKYRENSKIKKQQCTVCGKILSSRFRLQTHLRTHTGERPFPCLHCSKSFALKMGLNLHLRIHTGEKPFQCQECKASFRHPSSLRAHTRKHTGERPYHCMLCPKTFHTASNLQYHVRKHTGEKNFECDSCGKAFISRSHLQQHLILHSDERPHMCSVCGLRLSRVSHLRRHMQNVHNVINKEPSQVEDLDKNKGKSKPVGKKARLKEKVNESSISDTL